MAHDYHVGVDYHKAYSHIVVQDGGGKTVRSGRVRNDRRSVAGFLAPSSLSQRERERPVAAWRREGEGDMVFLQPPRKKIRGGAAARTPKVTGRTDVSRRVGRSSQDVTRRLKSSRWWRRRSRT